MASTDTAIPKQAVLAALELRYDYYSARVVLAEALSAAELADPEGYSAGDLDRLRPALLEVGSNMSRVFGALDALAPEPEPARAEAPATEPPRVEPPRPEPPPAPAKKAPKKKPTPKEAKEPSTTEAPGPVEVRLCLAGAPEGLAHVVGSIEELGGWEPDRASAMSKGADGAWEAKLMLVPATAVELKFLVRKEGEATWEGGENRTFEVPEKGPLRFEATWQA